MYCYQGGSVMTDRNVRVCHCAALHSGFCFYPKFGLSQGTILQHGINWTLRPLRTLRLNPFFNRKVRKGTQRVARKIMYNDWRAIV